jgi:sulfite reductase (NADPH) flavoprotein alpha-component
MVSQKPAGRRLLQKSSLRIRKQTILRLIRIYVAIVHLDTSPSASSRICLPDRCSRRRCALLLYAPRTHSNPSMPMQRSLTQRILFRIHWIAGITAGLVLAVVGFTGALINVESATLDAINPAFRIVAPPGAQPMSLASLVDAARAANPGYDARSLAWNGDDRATSVRLARGRERGGIDVGVDPYSGAVLGEMRGKDFFDTAEQLHRNLAAGPVGKQIVGASTAILIVIAITGIVLRWPRRHSWKTWLRFDSTLRGRPLWWRIHGVLATWMLAFYLVASLTGLWWAYDFYRNAINAMAGVPAQQRRGPMDGPAIEPARLDAAWTAFRRETNGATRATIMLAAAADTPVEIRYQDATTPHERAWNTAKIAADGSVASRELYAELPRGRRFVSSLFPLHNGSFFGVPGRIAMTMASAAMPFFAITGVWLWILRRRNAAARRTTISPQRARAAIAGDAFASEGHSP